MTRERLAMLGCLSLLVFAFPLAPVAQYTTATPIQHIIIVVQENHSFDNYFGTYPTANGTLVDAITSQLPSVNGIPDGVCLPDGSSCIALYLTTSTTPVDPTEGQAVYEADYSNNGTGFPENSGAQSMVYFDYHSIPAYWDYAEEYGLADNYFAPLLTQSNPNRLMLLTGETPVASDNGPPPYIEYNTTLLSQLETAGVSWGYFDWVSSNGSQNKISPLDYITGMSPAAVNSVQDIPTLYKDLSSGSGLPSVSFVNSLHNTTYDEHPTHNPTTGEEWVVSLVNRVMSSSYWNSTAIFITWDEGGGFYDHVIPPSEYTLSGAGFASPLLGLGQRIPLLVISPFSKEAYVSDTLMSHLSLDHLIEYNWKLPPLNAYVAGSNLPLGFFDFSAPLRAPIVLGTTGAYSMTTYPIPLQLSLGRGPTSLTTTSTSQTAFTNTTAEGSATTATSVTTTVMSSVVSSTFSASNRAAASSVSPVYSALVAISATVVLIAASLVSMRIRDARSLRERIR